MKIKNVIASLIVILLLGASFTASAQTTNSWNVNAGGLWSASGNWSPASVPNASGSMAFLTNNITAARIVTNDAAFTLGKLQVGSADGLFSFTITNVSSGAMTFDNSAAGAQIIAYGANALDRLWTPIVLAENLTITNAKSLQISSVISETGGAKTITKVGAGTLTLSGTGDFSGGLIVKEGAVSAASGGASRAGTGMITLGNTTGSSLAQMIGSATYTNAVTVVAGSTGVKTIRNSGTSAALGVSGPITLNDDLTLNAGNSTVSVTISGAIDGTGAVLSTGSSTVGIFVALTAANSFSGGLTLQSGTLRVGNAAALGTGPLTLGVGVLASASSTAYALTNAVLVTNNFTLGEAATGTGALTLSGDVNLGVATRTITVNNTTADILSGAISGDPGVGIIKAGSTSSTLQLSGTSTYDGGLTIRAGNVTLAGKGAGTGMITLGNTSGSSLAQVNGSGTYTNPITVAAGNTGAMSIRNTGSGVIAFSGDIALNHDLTLTVPGSGGGVSFGGVITGANALTINNAGTTGVGTFTLSGASTAFSGAVTLNVTTVTNGILRVGNDNALGTGTLTVTGAGTGEAILASTSSASRNVTNNIVLQRDLTLGQATTGTGTLRLYGNLDLGATSRTIKVANTVADQILGVISGTGGLAKLGAQQLNLYGVNTFSGGLTLKEANVYFDNGNAVGTGLVTLGDTAGSANVTLNGIGTVTNDIVLPNGSTGSRYLRPGGDNTTAIYSGGITLNDNNLNISCLVSNTTVVLGGVVTGAGGVAMSATTPINRLILTEANTYLGNTTVSSGTLVASNATGSATGAGAVTVASGATLTGNGSISGVVTMNGGSYLAPGSSVGDLTLGGDLTLAGGGSLVFEITNAANADKLIVGGSLSPSGTTTITLPNTVPLTNGDYTLLEVTGTLGGNASNLSVTSPNPAKTYSIVYQAGSPNKVVLQVTGGSVLTWTGSAGAASNVWDIATSANWLDSGSPAVFNDNNAVVFDDIGATNPVVDIAAAVSPSIVTVNAASDYTFTGSGGITGTNALIKSGAGALTLSNANTFSGGVALSAGTLNLNHASAPGTGPVTITGGTLDNTSGGAITLANDNPQAWNGDFAFTGTSDLNLGAGAVTPSANRTVTVSSNNLTVGGVISGTRNLTKAGAGTLTLDGDNTYTGSTIASAGTLALSGSLTNDGAVTVNGGILTVSGAISNGGVWNVGSASKAVLNITAGANILKTNYFRVGLNAGDSGAVNITGGSFTSLYPWSFYNFTYGVSGYGALKMTGGNVTTHGFILGGANVDTSMGMVSISGGTFTVDSTVDVPYYKGTAVLTVSTNGSLLRSLAGGSIAVNPFGMGRGEFNVTGGIIDNTNGAVSFGASGSATPGGSGIVNLDAGTLTTARFTASANGNSRLNFNGGMLRAATNVTTFIPAALTSVYVNGAFGGFSGGAVIDAGDFTNTIVADLLAPTGDGVSDLAVTDGGAGYIGEPYVSIVDSGAGFGATAIATMVDDGSGNGTLKVDSIKITNPGIGYTAGTTTYTLTGGGATSAATPGVVSTAANTSGGLTKLGAGILTLSGANTYTGSTTVSNGTLLVAGSLAGGSTVSVVSGATLGGTGTINGAVVNDGTVSPGAGGIGKLTVNNTLTLNAGGSMTLEIDPASGTNDSVAGLSSLTYGGTLNVVNLGGTFVGGESYQLFSATTYNPGNFSATNLPALTGGLTWNWNPANGTLSVVAGYATTSTNLTFSASSTTLSLTWPGSHLGWFAQSNAVDIADPNFWFNIPGSETATNLDIMIDPAQPNVFYRLQMP